MFLKFLPKEFRKFLLMNKRQRRYEIHRTLWYIPLLYVLAAVLIAMLTTLFDSLFNLPSKTDFFVVSFGTTRLLVSTLISSILLLSAFTLNILLVVLTTFSGQFSPRMLEDFIADRQTQHLVGIFNGNFVYVLFIFLFLSNTEGEKFVLVPIITVLLTFVTAVGFIFFINHSISWMQVHNITNNMKQLSKEIIEDSLRKDLENLKVMEAGDLKEEFRENRNEVTAPVSGYIQLVDFKGMVSQAHKDDIIIEFHEQIGSFILSGNTLFSYWGPKAEETDSDGYKKFFLLGHKTTEIQDANAAMGKLAELAVKSMGNNDPRSAINTIHQLADLMQTIESQFTFTRYLADDDGQVRVITQPQKFEDFLYRGFGMIRYYADGYPGIVTEIISSLRMLAQSSDPVRHTDIWHFAENTISNISDSIVYDSDQEILLKVLFQLAETTGNQKGYYRLEKLFPRDPF